MSDAHVYFADDVNRDTLIRWLRDHFGDNARRLGIRPDATDLGWFRSERADDEVAAWSQGRVFDRTHEVRWEQRGGAYAVWVLGEVIPEARELIEIPGPWTTVQVRPGLFLWGRYDKEWSDREKKATWIEVRIPRRLHYPATPPSEDEGDTRELFAQLGHIKYRAPNGAVQFTRLTEVR